MNIQPKLSCTIKGAHVSSPDPAWIQKYFVTPLSRDTGLDFSVGLDGATTQVAIGVGEQPASIIAKINAAKTFLLKS